MELNGVVIQDTFAEAWALEVVRLVITAISEEVALGAAHQFVGAAGSSELGSRINGGIERRALPQETPDGRPGIICAVTMPPNRHSDFIQELALRVHLATLIPTCAIFNGMLPQITGTSKMNVYELLRPHFNEKEDHGQIGGRRVCVVPTTTGEFVFEEELTVSLQGTDGHFVCYAENESAAVLAVSAGKKALEGIDGVSPMGFGLEQVYRLEEYCPKIREKVAGSKVPDQVGSILNLLMFGVEEALMMRALKESIGAACKVPGVKQIGAMNFGGEFGPYRFFLHQILKS
ncbi:hypothetical protein [Candidatus Formimonas warabiya]|uniref:Formylmethanofuran--tetrahydromethanopterin N-formyltransferase n=1 Tax=Formimonas warabiya TaxID=1761012 RepID=A0A3G1KTU6_FORW1|nr:hypothetical protein [Candidatus Formimonas warabiya]ATW25881.1 hypothetical protein DCMF_14865 [Candidatus Formimonas warabiya]